MDTSAIIDGRIAEIVESGFIYGTLVPRSCSMSPAHADSPTRSDAIAARPEILSLCRRILTPSTSSRTTSRTGRGRRSSCPRRPKPRDPDERLQPEPGRRAPGRPGDEHQPLANAVKPAVLPGEELRVRVIQEGKEAGQGVGFLDDGTMIVVEGGARHIDHDVDVSVTRVLQTVAGRMIFAQPRLD